MSNKNEILINENSKPGILRLVLNKPQSKNALSREMIFAMKDAISNASSNKKVKVIIIAANGDVFSAGLHRCCGSVQYCLDPLYGRGRTVS